MEEGYIGGGMLPKLNNCIDAIENGVSRVHILDGRLYTAEEYSAIYDEEGVKWEDKPTIRSRRLRRSGNV